MTTFVNTIPKRWALQATFRSGLTRPLPWRQHQLYQLARMAQNERGLVCDALWKDLGKPKTEALSNELGNVIDRAVKSAERLPERAKPEHPEVVDRQKPWNPTIYKAPKGTVLIISPWNFPMMLSFQPLIGAIAAGCTAEIVPKYLDPNMYRIVNSGIPETSKLLELQWDHIFYTDNGKVARIVASAAAKHLTPLTLELGGKSPVIIDSAYDICVAPDYVLVQRDKQDELVKALQSIITHSSQMGEVVPPGRADAARKRLELTIFKNVADGDSLLEEELFGPILPIVPVDFLDQAINFVNARSHPLVLYAFSDNKRLKQRLISETRSGGIVFNDTLQQFAVSELPFAGVGESGYGSQFSKYTYDTFTQLRSSMDMPREAEANLAMRYLPHSKEAVKTITAAVYTPIPPSSL
ncbi:aldehyde dehydrogenase [Suillus bovinus]|uniref:aldehyde dehydrogenase n=1 Tax=Suillus bovinus TaxID=48563 RepID=UPI001B85DEC4|nr:aldehyde dehydrogenase [Suillus bovinus]KAG2129419.1 aldehyde dehydrogenase [Suillus bovinus]